MKWSSEEEKILREMAKAGAQIGDVMKVLNRTRNSIDSKASTLGMSLAGKAPQINMEAFTEFLKNHEAIECL